MKTLTLNRNENTEHNPTGTEGVLYDNEGIKICDTLELHDENNAKGKSHIPTGTYTCKIINSPKHGIVYQVCDVPGRGNIEIHSANFAGDVDAGLKSELLGCVALGNGYGILQHQRVILQSKNTLALFMQKMNGEPFILNVVN